MLLPKGCRCSELSVFPKNWNTPQADITKRWYIHYRFYDASGKSKQVHIANMNWERNLKDRQTVTKTLIANEIKLLKERCYNPITRTYENEFASEALKPESALIPALVYAVNELQCEASTKASIKSSINKLKDVAQKLGYHNVQLRDVTPRHIYNLLNIASNNIPLTASSYNHYRSYLSMIFKHFFVIGCVELNPVVNIPKRKAIKKQRQILTEAERKGVKEYLEKEHYFFYRYMQIFFHSGARSTELAKLQPEHVDLINQRFFVTVKKGNQQKVVSKTIPNKALPYWIDIIQQAAPNQYLFSSSFCPGPRPMLPERPTKVWKKLIKQGLGINIDFYSLKHLHTTETVTTIGETAAASANSHTSTAMVISIYDVNRQSRLHEILKQSTVEL